MKSKQNRIKNPRPIFIRLLVLSCLALFSSLASQINFSQAGNLIDVTATLSNSRLSFRGEVTGVSGTLTDIAVESGYEYNSGDPTDPLKVNDVLEMDVTVDDPVIEEIVDADTLNLSVGTSAGEGFYLAEKSDLTVSFVTQSNITGSDSDWSAGYFRVLVPAADSGSYDGTPDAGSFDFDNDTPTVTCSADNTDGGDTHDFSGGIASGNGGQSVYGGTYHIYRCNYSGGDDGDTITMTISDIINPAPKTNAQTNPHDTGTADTYTVIVEHMNGSTSVDRTDAKVGVIEAVKVSAEVVPSMNFTISGIGVGTTACGQQNDVATTADSVPFGQLADLQSFSHAAQLLSLSTNALDGATITAVANDQLGLGGTACPGDTYFGAGGNDYDCIWDANVTGMGSGDTGDDGEADWGDDTSLTADTSTNRGFGYSLQQNTADANLAFQYNDGGGTYIARHFADPDAQDPVMVFNTNSDPTNNASSYVCYRIVPDALTTAGNYYNYITYTATPQF